MSLLERLGAYPSLRGCEGDERAARRACYLATGAARDTMARHCREDFLFWVNTFVYQYNPLKAGKEVAPWRTWPAQEEGFRILLESIEGQTDLVIEKSREMGWTWMCVLVFGWLWQFHPDKQLLMISKSADAVDSQSPNALFSRWQFVLDHQPTWLRPNYVRRKMHYDNKDLRSAIDGEASTGRAGVGGRATGLFVDEFSQIQEDYEVLDRTADTSKCRIFNFTHTGLGTAAYEIARGVRGAGMRKHISHWSEHPDKSQGLYRVGENAKVEIVDTGYAYPTNYTFVLDGGPGGLFPGLRSPWYDAEVVRRGSKRAVAMDLDIDPQGATCQFFDAYVIRTLMNTYGCEPYWTGDLSEVHGNQVRKRDLRGELVKASGGPLELWLHLDGRGRPPAGKYFIGVDVASGTGSTPSVVSIMDALGQKVGEYANARIMPHKLAELVVALCWLFKREDGEGAQLVWEIPGPGVTFGLQVIAIGYWNIYWKRDERKVEAFEGLSKPSLPGWMETRDAKRVLLEGYRAALQAKRCLNRSRKALEECLLFEYDKQGLIRHGREVAGEDGSSARENHGDRVIADSLAWKMVEGTAGVNPAAAENVIIPGSFAWRKQLAEMEVASEW